MKELKNITDTELIIGKTIKLVHHDYSDESILIGFEDDTFCVVQSCIDYDGQSEIIFGDDTYNQISHLNKDRLFMLEIITPEEKAEYEKAQREILEKEKKQQEDKEYKQYILLKKKFEDA